MNPEVVQAIRGLILVVMLGGFVVVVIATIRALISHEKQQKNKGKNL